MVFILAVACAYDQYSTRGRGMKVLCTDASRSIRIVSKSSLQINTSLVPYAKGQIVKSLVESLLICNNFITEINIVLDPPSK